MTGIVRKAPGPRKWKPKPLEHAAITFHSSMPGYRPTPLVALPELAAELGVAAVFVKDESERLGLPAFKILGASWAVNRALSLRDGYDTPAESLAELRLRIDSASLTLVTATDGNHGHALARVAALLGLEARIYVPGGTAAKTVATIASEGAQVIPSDLIYDDVIHAAAASTSGRSDELLVQDTAWQGYEDIPQWVVDGYGTLFYEIASQLGGRAIRLVAIPTGVGSLLLAALQHYRDPANPQHPAILAVEPVTAACVTTSLAAGQALSLDTSAPTIMAGLNCGTISTIAWPAIRDGLDAGIAGIAITDHQAASAMHRLHELGVRAGPCGAAALAGVRAALEDSDHRAALTVNEESALVLISTDGPV